MSCTTVFKDLIELYPAWDELQQYLESYAGGQFRVTDKKGDLCMIRYQKGVSRMDLPHSLWFRSVVWNRVANRPVSIAPPKAASIEFPCATMEEMAAQGMVCQEQLDGFMINCFRRLNDTTLYITSRSKVDAAGHFYSSKSFRTLFIESYMKISQSEQDLEQLIQTYGNDMEAPQPSRQEIAVCYSFLVQHVEHRIVTPVRENKVFLVHTCTVHEDGTVCVNDVNPVCRGQDTIPVIPWAPLDEADSVADTVFQDSAVVQWVKRLCRGKTWEFQGVVFKDSLGHRWRFRNDAYAMVKALRGNSATSLERFSQLYTQDLIYSYLQYYPDDNFYFSCHTIFMNMIIKSVYEYYIALFVAKTVQKEEIDRMYLPHLYAIHSVYIRQLRPDKKKVTPHHITCYFHEQPWQRIAFLLKRSQDAYFVQMGEIVQGGQDL